MIKVDVASRSRVAASPCWIFTLPTEAQWEYACGAGTTSGTTFGGTLRTDLANFALEPPTRANVADYPARARPVGSYPANPWGILRVAVVQA